MPAKLLAQDTVFKRYFSVEVVEVEPRSLRHDGYAAKMTREVMRIGDVAAVLLYDPENDQILLNQQFRVGPFLAGEPQPFLFECAMGLLDDGEAPEEGARREALEETGTPVQEMESVGIFYPSAGALDERFHLFVGRIENAEAGIHGIDSESEEIKTHLLPAKKVIEMLDAGEIRSGMSALLLHWFARHHAELRTQWLKK